MATYLDGNVRKATANTVTSMKRSAEHRRCPLCDRKSALVRDPEMRATYCRWSAEGHMETVKDGPSGCVGSKWIAMCSYYKSWDDE